MRKHPLADCDNCPLKDKDFVPTQGPQEATVAFVSRSPGIHDTAAKRPFAGPSGRVLDHLLNLYEVNRDEIITTNVVLCKSDDPPAEAIEACRPRLQDEIKNATTILAAAVEAVHELIDPRTSITSARRRTHSRTSTRRMAQRVIATTNPAVVLRESGNFPDMVRDFRLALAPRPVPKLPQVWYTDDANEAMEILKELGTHLLLASDLETFGWTGRIACAGFAHDIDMAYVIGFRALEDQWVMDEIKKLYENRNIEWVWHNGKYDFKVLRKNGINGRIDQDTFLICYALDERPGGDYRGDQGAGLHALTLM